MSCPRTKEHSLSDEAGFELPTLRLLDFGGDRVGHICVRSCVHVCGTRFKYKNQRKPLTTKCEEKKSSKVAKRSFWTVCMYQMMFTCEA